MSKHPLTPPPAVPPPANGLGSNSNYILTNQCNPITGLIVTIDVTQDIVLQFSGNAEDHNGYTFQLNCYSPPGFTDAWQQYVFSLLAPIFPRPAGPAQLSAGVNNWPSQGGNAPLINDSDSLMELSGTTIPAGYQLQIQLKNDGQNNIVGAHWIVNYVGVLPTPTTPLTGYVTVDSAGNTEPHINFIGIDGHIHERTPTSTKFDNDLSVLAGSSIFPAAHSALDAYADLDGGQHVNFIGTDGHVHELYIAQGGRWIDNDLNQLAKGSPILPMLGSPLDGYVDNDGGQHVNFIGTDSHVHELLIASGGHWINNDLISLSGNGIAPRFDSPIDGYVDNNNGQHVNFIGTDGHVRELYIKPKGQWINNDLIMLSGNGVAPSRTSSLCGYMAQDNGQHVNFIGTDGHVRELYNLHSNQWLNNDLTELAQLSGPSVSPAPHSALCGFWADYVGGGTQHVTFTGTDGHVHDLSIAPKGQWADSDLTQLSGAGATPTPNSALSSYGTTHDEFFVNFIDVNDGHLHQFALVAPAQCIDNDVNNIPLANFLKSPIGLPVAPINAFEFNLIGPGNSAHAIFSSGAGTITYAASAPLTVLECLPPCVGTSLVSSEKSNSVYGSLDAGPSIVITQTFSFDPTERIIHAKGPESPGLKLPLMESKPRKLQVQHQA
jgi:hypothetical protein